VLHHQENNKILRIFNENETVNSVPRQLLQFVRRMPTVEDDYILRLCITVLLTLKLQPVLHSFKEQSCFSTCTKQSTCAVCRRTI